MEVCDFIVSMHYCLKLPSWNSNEALIAIVISYLEECNVDKWGVEVNKLENEYLECVAVFIFCLCPWIFHVGKPEGQSLI